MNLFNSYIHDIDETDSIYIRLINIRSNVGYRMA